LPQAQYQYKYRVEFENGVVRKVGDPCTKYGGTDQENAAFVVGGRRVRDRPVQPLLRQRRLDELVIYELMIDDFTSGYRGGRAPLDAVVDKLEYIRDLGVNAIELMPWTAWPGNQFSWGYNPFAYFSVEDRYTRRDPAAGSGLEKLTLLQDLITACHRLNLAVIMDGVFNHVDATNDRGFAYSWLYQDPSASPFVGSFGDGGFFTDIDYHNFCARQFVADACRYWLNLFGVDGIRFDYVRGFFVRNSPQGATGLVTVIKDELAQAARSRSPLILEDLPDNRYEAVDDTNVIGASGCWFDPLMFACQGAVDQRFGRRPGIDGSLMRALDSGRDFDSGAGPITYIENHDHTTITNMFEGRARWFRMQPGLIALFSVAGAPMIHNGQEFANDAWMPEQGDGRVIPRPLSWDQAVDPIATQLRAVVSRLAGLRRDHPALRSRQFFPTANDQSRTTFDGNGFGVDTQKQVAIFHKWAVLGGTTERLIVVINFSEADQTVDVPFSIDGRWTDLLGDTVYGVNGFWLRNHTVPSNWGRIFQIVS
jgi:pullulanase/glycogen debranching enzyme